MRRFLYPILYILLIVLTVLVYAGGLRGTFLFDDFANLPALGASGPIRDTDSFLRFITSGTADPLGRPVALASFLLDANDWPSEPLPFKRTNLLIHASDDGTTTGVRNCCSSRRDRPSASPGTYRHLG